MKKTLTAGLSIAAVASFAFAANSLDANPNYQKLKEFKPKDVSNDKCLMCHKTTDPGIVADWQHSKHLNTQKLV